MQSKIVTLNNKKKQKNCNFKMKTQFTEDVL